MISKNPPYVLLDASSQPRTEAASYFFCDFERSLVFRYSDDPLAFFRTLQNYLDKGYWAAGYITYELGYYLEPALRSLRKDYDFDLAWFGLTKKPQALDRQIFEGPDSRSEIIKNVKPNISETEYVQAIKKIKKYLENQ